MDPDARIRSSVRVKFPLGFADSGADYGPRAIWARVRTRSGAEELRLEPIRYRASDDVGEWHLAYDGSVRVDFFALIFRGNQFFISRSAHSDIDIPIRITLGELPPENLNPLDPARETFVLTGGSIGVPDPEFIFFQDSMYEFIWPTRDSRDVTHLRIEPGGLFVEGRLPAAFFPPGVPEASRTAILRLPRDREDTAPVEEGDGDEVVARLVWSLTAHPFRPEGHDATRHVRGWVEAYRGFALPPLDGRSLNTLVDSTTSAPEERCVVSVFRKPAAEERLSWFARDIATRLNLGGGGAVAESTFVPDRLAGTASTTAAGDWTVRLTAAPIRDPRGRPDDPSALTIELRRTGAEPVRLGLTTTLAPLVAPTVPVEHARTEAASSEVVTERRAERLWLCTDDGWTAIDAPGATAVVDPDAVPPGTILGVLELGRLISGLTASDRPGLSIDAQATGFGAVGLELRGRTPPRGAGSIDRLSLTLTRPFLTVTTPSVFYTPPTPVPSVALPSLTSGLEPGSLAIDSPEYNAFLEQLDRELADRRFQRSVFVSTNSLRTDTPVPQLLTGLEFSGGAFLLAVPAESTTVWQRPARLPLARTFPLVAEQDLGGFLDANRGLLPFRHASGARIALAFSPRGLPRIVASPQPDYGDSLLGVDPSTGRPLVAAGWQLTAAASGGGAGYLLTTLPGAELDTAPQAESPPKPLQWVFRHAVPALDEAYSVAVEARRDPTQAADATPRPPTPGELPPGFDPTRVVGTEAFRFADALPDAARGWLHQTETNRQGALAIAPGGPPELLGRFPRLPLELGDAHRPVVFSRTESVAGLSADLVVDVPAEDSGDLPSFTVGLAPRDDPDAGRERIARSGQPLLNGKMQGKVVTHDALGVRREEPDPAGRLVRSRGIGASVPTRRYSGRERLIPGALVLDMIGVDLAEDGAAPSGSALQSWMLHDGEGGVPSLAGLPVIRRKLVAPRVVGGYLEVELELVIGMRSPRSTDAPDGPREPLPLPGERSAKLRFRRPFATPESAWQLAEVTGGLDWQFRDTGTDAGEPELTRLQAKLLGAPEGASWPLEVTRLEVAGPTGPLTLDGLSVPATLEQAVLTTTGDVAVTSPAFSVTLEPFEVETDALSGGVVPDAVVLEHYAFEWSPDPAEDTLRRRLTFAQAGQAHRGSWTLEVLRDDTPILSAVVDATPAAPAAYLFRSRADSEAEPPALPEGSWFARTEQDLVLAGARFERPDLLATLSCEVRLSLRMKEMPTVRGQRPLYAADAGAAQLVVRWSLPRRLAEQALQLSGWLDLANQIRFERAGATGITQVARLFFDRARWSFEALFLGLGPERPVVFSCVVEHTFRWGDGKSYTFQAVQPLRLRRAAQFVDLYMRGTPAGNLPDRLTIDGSWVFWLSEPEPVRPVSVRSGAIVGSIELESAALSEWIAFRTRAPERGGFATRRAFIGRLPFGCAGPSPLPDRVVRLTDAPRQAFVSGAQGGITIDPIAAESGATDPDLHAEFLRRGANVRWLDTGFLGRLFSTEDLRVGVDAQRLSREFLPGYEGQGGHVVTTLPRDLGDWPAPFLAAADATRSEAAALRTPYVPHQAAVPIRASNLLETPFTVRNVPPREPEAGERTEVQLLAFSGDELRVIRRAALESTEGAPTPRDWALAELAAARRNEAAILLIGAEGVEIIPRPLDPTRGSRERPTWPTAPIGLARTFGDRPPRHDEDPSQRPPAPADVWDDRAVLDPPDASDETGRWRTTPQWHVFAARPEIAPERLKTRGVAATRLRLALAGTPARLAPSQTATAEIAAGGVKALARGTLLGITKSEEVPFLVSDETAVSPAALYPAPGAAPHARRDALVRSWEGAEALEYTRIVTLAAPLIDVVTWARRPGELTRSLIAGLRLDVVPGEVRGFRYSPAPGQEVTLRRSRAQAGPYERVSIDVAAPPHTIPNRFFQYVRLDLNQTLDATAPPEPGGVNAVLAAKSEINVGSRDVSQAETRPAIIRKPAAGGVEPFELWLVADAGFVPNRDFPNGNRPALRTVVVLQATGDVPPANDTPSGPPIEVPEDSDGEDEERRVVLFQEAGSLLPNPGAAPWLPIFEGVFALPVRSSAGPRAPEITQLATDLSEFFVLVLQYTKATDADDARWVAPAAPIAVIKVAKIDSANEPVLPKSVAAVLHAPRELAAEATQYSLCGYAQLDADDFGPIAPSRGPEEDGRTLVAWSRIANLQTLDRLAGIQAEERFVDDPPAFAYDVVFYGPGGELVPITEEDS